MNKKPAKLTLRTQTLRRLGSDDVARVAGGVPVTRLPNCVIDPIPTGGCLTPKCTIIPGGL